MSVEQIERAREVVPVAAVQNHYSYVERGAGGGPRPLRARRAWCSSRTSRSGAFGGGAVAEVAERHGATESQVALAWLLHRAPVTLPIPGTLSPEHLRENLAALEIELSEDDLRELG